jgi:hypothetical protein
MKIHYSFDDSAARLPLSIRSADAVWDRVTELRNAPGIHLVELTTQHMLNTGNTLTDELAHYFDTGAPTESDPYGLTACYTNRELLEDLLRDLRDMQSELAAFDEVEALFPASFRQEINLTLALAAVGFPAFGYVRTYKDSEGEEYHGMVVNLAQARPHLENYLGQFSLSLLIDTIRYGFFNHESFLLAYRDYCQIIGRTTEGAIERLKEALLSRGIAWYLSYHHNPALYNDVLALGDENLARCVKSWNHMIDAAKHEGLSDETLDNLLRRRETRQPDEMCIDVVGCSAARAIAAAHGDVGLREAVVQGPDRLIALYNALGQHKLQS